MKPTSFCTAKETINNMKRQLMEWEKFLQMTYKGLISKIYKQLIQINTTTKNTNQTMGRRLK